MRKAALFAALVCLCAFALVGVAGADGPEPIQVIPQEPIDGIEQPPILGYADGSQGARGAQTTTFRAEYPACRVWPDNAG
jgi:hypothetical protein